MAEIRNSIALTSIFGRWPSFHDAEVLSFALDRAGAGECPGPTIEARVHVFRITSAVNSKGSFVLADYTLVTLRFLFVQELRLEDFNHQNALMGLKIADISSRGMENILFEVSFDGAWGLSAKFQCAAVEAVSAVPFSPSR